MTLPLPTVVDLKAHLNFDNPTAQSTDDDELGYFLSAAVDLVEGMVGPLAARSVTETHYGVSSDVLVLRTSPAVALTSVGFRYYAGSAFTTGLLTDYALDGDLGVVRLASGARFRGDYTVTYTAGRSGIPYAVSVAALVIAAHLWQTQRGPQPTPGPLGGPDDELSMSPGMGYALPNRAMELLQPYAQVHVA